MNERINGKSFDFSLGGIMIHVDSVNISISDDTAAAQTNGVPDGYLRGSVSAEGDITVSAKYFKAIRQMARSAGSFRDIPAVDFLFYANTGSETSKIEAFGCKLVISDLLTADKNSTDKTTHTIHYVVTSPQFVRIDGIPYLSENDTRGLLS